MHPLTCCVFAAQTNLPTEKVKSLAYLHVCLLLDDGTIIVNAVGDSSWKPAHLQLMEPHRQRMPLEEQIRDLAAGRARDGEEHRRVMDIVQMDVRSLQQQLRLLLNVPSPPRGDAALPASPDLAPQPPVPTPPSAAVVAAAASSSPPPLQQVPAVPPAAARNATAAPPATPLDSPARNTRGAARRKHVALCAVRKHAAMEEPACPVCWCGWGETDLHVFFACGHRICDACSEQDEHLRCPICRHPTGPSAEWVWGRCDEQ